MLYIDQNFQSYNTIFSTFTEEDYEYEINAKIYQHAYCAVNDPHPIIFRSVDGDELQQYVGCNKADNRYNDIP